MVLGERAERSIVLHHREDMKGCSGLHREDGVSTGESIYARVEIRADKRRIGA